MASAYGWLSLIPPIVAITLAIKTRKSVSSLLAGVFVGYCIYVWFAPDKSLLAVPNPVLGPFFETIDALLASFGDPESITLFAFIGILGGIVQILVVAGGAEAFAIWSEKRIKTRRGAQLATFGMGISILIDDYFNALTVGNVMQPISDRLHISRAKLAYNIDSTSAPDTILFPMSSWVATCVLLINPVLVQHGFADTGFSAFLKTIPYNYYSWLTLLFVILVSFWDINIGPMVGFERAAREGHDGTRREVENEYAGRAATDKARASDLMLPMLVLALQAVVFMMGTGGFFDGASLVEALQSANSTLSLVYAGVGTLVFVFVLYIPRGLMTVDEFGDAFMQGFKDMLEPMAMLLLAWTVSRVMGDDVLATGPYVASLVPASTPGLVLPLVMFVATGAIAFTTGVSWGAMAIMVPPSIAICAHVAPDTISLVLGGVFAGVIFGDHCSPLSDTTILSSTGAGCNHIDHVRSQLPYALTSGAVSCATFVFAGVVRNPWVSLAFGLLAMWATAFALHLHCVRRDAAERA
jgi:Na+/H+ antiporter NhaC